MNKQTTDVATFVNCAAQGDMLITRVEKLPDGLTVVQPEGGNFILTHSETGHHHVTRAEPGVQLYQSANDPLLAYLVVDNTKSTEVRHLREFDTHKTLRIDSGVYRINRQREDSPEGWRRALD